MEKDAIICPNCGAENEYGGTCQYCGCVISNGSSGIIISEDLDENKSFIEDKYGLFQQKYDKYNNTTQSILCYGDSRIINIVRTVHSSGVIRTYLRFTKWSVGSEMILLLDEKRKIKLEHNKGNRGIEKSDFAINKDVLHDICQCQKLEGRFPGVDEELSFFIPRAQLYYNRVYDNSEYTNIYEEALKNKSDEYRSSIYYIRKARYSHVIGNIETRFRFGRDIVLSFDSRNIGEIIYINGREVHGRSSSWDSNLTKGREYQVDFFINKGILEELCNAKSIEILYRESTTDPYFIEDETDIIGPLARTVYDEQYENSLNNKSLDELYDLITKEREKSVSEKQKQAEVEKEKRENRIRRKNKLFDHEVKQKQKKKNLYTAFYSLFMFGVVSSVLVFLYSGYKIYTLGVLKMQNIHSEYYEQFGNQQSAYWNYLGVSFIVALILYGISNTIKNKKRFL